jgi:predicted nucleotidyltransferase
MTAKIIIESEHLQIVENVLKKHLSAQAKVWAFGSRVKGNVKKFSDLDLAIDAEGNPLSLELLADINYEFEESDLPYKVDIVDWNTISQSFKNLITEDRILIKRH